VEPLTHVFPQVNLYTDVTFIQNVTFLILIHYPIYLASNIVLALGFSNPKDHFSAVIAHSFMNFETPKNDHIEVAHEINSAGNCIY